MQDQPLPIKPISKPTSTTSQLPVYGSAARSTEVWTQYQRCWTWLSASLLEGAFEHNGQKWPTHNARHIWDRIVRGQLFFWPFPNCAFLTYFETSPTGLRSHVTWLAGGSLTEIIELTPQVERWGWMNGCHRQIGHGRRGWLRALDGYAEFGTKRQKSLLP